MVKRWHHQSGLHEIDAAAYIETLEKEVQVLRDEFEDAEVRARVYSAPVTCNLLRRLSVYSAPSARDLLCTCARALLVRGIALRSIGCFARHADCEFSKGMLCGASLTAARARAGRGRPERGAAVRAAHQPARDPPGAAARAAAAASGLLASLLFYHFFLRHRSRT